MSLLDTASLIVTPNAYKEGKLYSVIPSDGSGDMSVIRATTATRVNSSGLVELVPYNLLTYSEQFDNAAWTFLNAATITPNSTTAPDGTLTADTLTFTASVSSCVAQPLSVSQGNLTISIYAKVASGTKQFKLRLDSPTANESPNFTATTEWQRFEFNTTTAGNVLWFYVINSDTATAGSVFIWGAQLVEGSTALPYQKTETRLNIPRLDYSNGTCPSLLVEPQRTNLNLYSEDLSNAWYSKFNSSISTNNNTSPNGLNTADKIVENTNNSFHYVETANSLSAGNPYTVSVYLKKAERNYGYIGVYTFESKQIRVNLINGTIESTVGTWISTNIKDVGNDWYRVSGTFDAYSTSYFFSGPALDGTSNPIYTGDGTSGIYLWGAQLEAGSYPTSYIPTTSASVTRNADVISKTGISSLIGQTEGTLFVDFVYNGENSLLSNVLNANRNVTSSFYVIRLTNGTIESGLAIGGVAVAQIIGGSILSGSRIKLAYSYKSGDSALYINGVQIGTSVDSFAFTQLVSEINIADAATYFGIQQSILNNAAALWKTRLTNAQLATLTTI